MPVKVKTQATEKEAVEELCKKEGMELIKFEGVFGTFYAAIGNSDEVYAIVLKIKMLYDGYEITVIHENELPRYHDASLELLGLLTPTTNQNATIWRKRTAIKE